MPTISRVVIRLLPPWLDQRQCDAGHRQRFGDARDVEDRLCRQ